MVISVSTSQRNDGITTDGMWVDFVVRRFTRVNRVSGPPYLLRVTIGLILCYFI